MENGATETIVKFGAALKFYDIPSRIIRETKRILLDAVGCALGAGQLDRGRIAAELAAQLGGKPEATILGTRNKVSCPNAAFANGELMQAMDFGPVLPPGQVTPFVVPALLALAEAKDTTGKELISALAVAHEAAARVGIALGNAREKEGGLPPRSYGFAGNALGAALGAARILKLDADKTANAFGLAGYFAPLPAYSRWLHTPASGMAMYGSAGWTAQAGVTAALLAERGYQGDKTILDGDYGFWTMTGAERCAREKLTAGLGQDWILAKATYKRWPCCDVFAAALDAFSQILERNSLPPEEIDKVVIKAEGCGALPRFQAVEITNHVDAQASLPYNIALVAYKIEVGPGWQSPSTMADPRFREFMAKVSYETYPRSEEARHQELDIEGLSYINRRPACAEVEARGQRFTQEVEYANWLSADERFRASDEGLADKFRKNTAAILREDKQERVIEAIGTLEKLDNISKLVKLLTL